MFHTHGQAVAQAGQKSVPVHLASFPQRCAAGCVPGATAPEVHPSSINVCGVNGGTLRGKFSLLDRAAPLFMHTVLHCTVQPSQDYTCGSSVALYQTSTGAAAGHDDRARKGMRTWPTTWRGDRLGTESCEEEETKNKETTSEGIITHTKAAVHVT